MTKGIDFSLHTTHAAAKKMANKCSNAAKIIGCKFESETYTEKSWYFTYKVLWNGQEYKKRSRRKGLSYAVVYLPKES